MVSFSGLGRLSGGEIGFGESPKKWSGNGGAKRKEKSHNLRTLVWREA